MCSGEREGVSQRSLAHLTAWHPAMVAGCTEFCGFSGGCRGLLMLLHVSGSGVTSIG